MTPGLVALAALLAWGPVAPAEEAPPPEIIEPAPAVPQTPPAPPPPLVTTAPIDGHARPVLVAAPARHHEPSKPLYEQWGFWAIVGGFVAATVTLTILATRPAQNAYRGNAPPYYMPFP